MSSLWLANCTKQTHHFIYRNGVSTGTLLQVLPIGGQARLPGDLSHEQIEHIIEQHRVFGIRDVSEIKNTKEFTGVCYNIGNPVPFVAFDAAFETNDAVITAVSAEKRALVVEAIAQRSMSLSAETGDQLQRMEVRSETDKKAEGIPEMSVGAEVVMEGVQPKRGTLSRNR